MSRRLHFCPFLGYFFLGGFTSFILAHPHMGHCLGSALSPQLHFFPHFKHIQSVISFTLFEILLSLLIHLILSIKSLHPPRMCLCLFCNLFSASSACIVGSCNLNFFWHKRYFFAAFGAFTIMSLNYLIWRLQF